MFKSEYLKQTKYQRLIDEYLDELLEMLPVLMSYLEAGNFFEIEEFGHKLKGNGEAFGFPEFSRFGERLESAAGSQYHGEVEKYLSELETVLNQSLAKHFG